MQLNKILTTALLLVSFASANDTLVKIINNNYDINSSYKLVEASSEEKSRYAESIGMAYNQLENRFEAYASSAGDGKNYDIEQDKFYAYKFVEKGFDYDCTTKTLKRPCPAGSEEFGNTSHCRIKVYSEPSCNGATPHYGNNGICYSDEGLTCKNAGVLWTDGNIKDTCFKDIQLFSLTPIGGN
jgi:hypothetical protein